MSEPTTGLIVACPTCGEVHEQIGPLQATIAKQAKEIAALKAQQTRQRRNSTDREALERLHAKWQQLLGHPRAKLGPAREKAYLFGLHTYDEEFCGRAIEGCARMPFVGPHGRQASDEKGGKRHDDPTLIFRDETTVERFAGYVDEPVEGATPARLRVERLAWGIWRANGGGSIAGSSHWPEVREQWVDHADEALRLARAGEGFVESQRGELRIPVQSVKPLDLRNVLEAFAERGLKVIGRGAQFKGQCPIHEDRTPSCSITEKPDGMTLLNCFGCQASHIELARALNLYGRDRDGGPRPMVGQLGLESSGAASSVSSAAQLGMAAPVGLEGRAA